MVRDQVRGPVGALFGLWSAVASIALASGCSEPPVGRHVGVTDSAGVRIVRNGPVAGVEAPWRLTRRPVMRIGWADDEPWFESILHGRIAEDGSVVVGDQSSRKVWKIATDGEILAEWGGPGDGPGEFRSVHSVVLDGDSVFVGDGRAGRVSVFHGDGVVRDFRVPVNQGSMAGVAEDGDLLRLHWDPVGMVYDPGKPWVHGLLLKIDREGAVRDTVLYFPTHQARVARGVYDPFGPFGWVVPTDSLVLVARSDLAEVRWFSLSGQLRRIVRWEQVRLPVTEESWDTYATSYRGLSSPEVDASRSDEELFGGLRDSASRELPLFRGVYVDPDGNVWLGENVIGYEEPERFSVIDSEGRWLGSVEVPSGFRILDIGADAVLGLEKDDWDVEAVSVYGLLKR